MTKITEIAAVLSEKHGLSTEEAERFAQTMFDVASENLTDDEAQVKIKDFGTFKVTAVSPRESIDVNTGERITIVGRNKITFLPEPALRDRVNQPFAQFKSVPLNDGVDFSAIDAEMQQTPDETNPITAQKEPERATKEPETQPETSPFAEQKEPDRTTKEPLSHAEDAAVQPKATETPEEERDSAGDTPSETAIDTTPVDEQKDKDGGEEAPATSDNGGDNDGDNDDNGGEDDSNSDDDEPETSDDGNDNDGRTRLLTIAVVALLLIITAGTWYFFEEISQRDDRIAALEERLNALDAATIAAPTDTVAAQNDGIAAVEAQETDTVEAATAAEKEPEFDPKQFNGDARVRTGAYIITGIAYTVEAQPGQTLKSISKAQLGPGMECYVEAVNGKTEFAAGETVKIPKLKMKKGVSKK